MAPSIRSFLALALLLAGPLAAQDLPDGITDEVLTTSISEPVGLAIAPDGRIFIIGQWGWIDIYAQGSVGNVGNVPNLLTPAAAQSSAAGLLGIDVDPGWPVRPFIYCYWTYDSPRSKRLSRFEVTGDLNDPTSTNLSLGQELPLITGIPDATSIHNGGSLRFGPGGKLHLSIGEDFTSACQAQDPSSLLGKVLRLDVSGLPLSGGGPIPLASLVPAGNPFQGPNDEARLVYALGLRNPFRFAVDPLTGNLFVGDVGGQAFEELNEVSTGGLNFGWPWTEGPAAGGGCGGTMPVTEPAVALIDRQVHTGPASIVALPPYRNRPGGSFNFGPGYEGDVFYAEFFEGYIRRLVWDGSAWVTPPPVQGQPNPQDWAVNMGKIADAQLGPDGAVYYVRRWLGISLRRLKGSTPSLNVVSGDGQVGTAGQPLGQPLRVQLLDAAGQPLSGIPVTFSVSQGAGTLGPQPASTGTQGFVETTFTLATSPAVDPVISASAAGVDPATFNVTWRGLSAAYVPSASLLTLSVRHSATSSPLTVAFDAPQASPVPTPFGGIHTSILNPGPSLGAFDGLGLIGPADPTVVTGSTEPVWDLGLTNLPQTGGLTLTFQAYALDTALLPQPAAVMISNPVTITFN